MNRRLKYATFCSGIECMSVACDGLPLDPVFFSEIEPFPCAVLKAHYPTIPNLGDMSKIRRDENGNITNGTTTIPFPDGGIDILAAGCPCQDFSVAGKRAGGAEGSGTRSSLIFEFIRIIGEIRPRWFIYENVVGMLSTNEGRDFAHILLAFRDCGYTLAWRVLDAQYVRVDGVERAVPQRRRRVWVVGCLGADESLPAQILFEPDCVAGHTAPRRCTGQGFAYSLARRDSMDAGMVENAPGTCEGRDGEIIGTINYLGNKGSAGASTANISPTLSRPSGSDSHVVALDGDKLKPREDQRKGGNGFGVNEEGAGYTLTGVDRHGVAYGMDARNTGLYGTGATGEEVSMTQDANQYKGGKCVVQCYENHAQDSRIKPIEVSDTRNQKDGTGGNNLPLVCFSKVSHPTAPNGEGERWDEREVAQTRNTFDNGEKRCQEVVVSTAYKLDSTASNSMKSANPNSGFHETQVAACLDTTTPDPSKGQGGNVIISTNANGLITKGSGEAILSDEHHMALQCGGGQCGQGTPACVISTNSNGGDVAATLTQDLAKQTGAQQANGGGYVMTRNLSVSDATCSTPERTPPSPPTSALASSRPSPQEPRRAQSAQG